MLHRQMQLYKILSDNVIRDSAVKVTNIPGTSSNQTPTTVNIIDDTPKETNTSAQKQNPLRPYIEKYSKYYQKNQNRKMGDGKTFTKMNLLLEIHKHYSFEDTIIIAMHVLRDNGVKTNFAELEGLLTHMADGTLQTYKDEMNASYYKNEMDEIHESHKAISSEAKKYSDIFNRYNGKLLSDKLTSRFCYLDLIAEIFRTHSSIEDTILIATYTLKHSGLDVTAASIENTVNQMLDGTVHTNNTEYNTPGFYKIIMNMMKAGHERGIDFSDMKFSFTDL